MIVGSFQRAGMCLSVGSCTFYQFLCPVCVVVVVVVFFFQDLLVVVVDYLFCVVHAAVTNLDGVSVKYLS